MGASGMSFGAPEVTFGKFRHHFDFWSQLKPGSNLDNLGGYLGNICLEVSMGVWVPSVGSLWGVSWEMQSAFY